MQATAGPIAAAECAGVHSVLCSRHRIRTTQSKLDRQPGTRFVSKQMWLQVGTMVVPGSRWRTLGAHQTHPLHLIVAAHSKKSAVTIGMSRQQLHSPVSFSQVVLCMILSRIVDKIGKLVYWMQHGTLSPPKMRIRTHMFPSGSGWPI